jgi:ABC-type dipeptide/oligopeptide/nickel transport system ATPase component
MQQRAMIAMALACHPRVLVADEPTTALDVTIQKQIIDLLKELQRTEDLTILLITHNFGIVNHFAQRVVVMFRGEIVEQGRTEQILREPRHPYTRALIACIPTLGRHKHRLQTIDYSKL